MRGAGGERVFRISYFLKLKWRMPSDFFLAFGAAVHCGFEL
jgi:hypothetical protein